MVIENSNLIGADDHGISPEPGRDDMRTVGIPGKSFEGIGTYPVFERTVLIEHVNVAGIKGA